MFLFDKCRKFVGLVVCSGSVGGVDRTVVISGQVRDNAPGLSKTERDGQVSSGGLSKVCYLETMSRWYGEKYWGEKE